MREGGGSRWGQALAPLHSALDPRQERWDRILVLYPTSLAIFSEEADRLCFKVGPPTVTRPREAPVCRGGRGRQLRRNLYFGASWDRASWPHLPASWSVWSQLCCEQEGPCLGTCVTVWRVFGHITWG